MEIKLYSYGLDWIRLDLQSDVVLVLDVDVNVDVNVDAGLVHPKKRG